MTYALDTDHISLLDRGGIEGERIRTHLARTPPDDVSATVISFEEQMRGWMSAISQARNPRRQILFYRELERLLRFYCITPLLPFDERAVDIFERLRQSHIRVGAMDLKIAAIALANNSTLLSLNTSHFSKIPGLAVEDWTV